MISWRYHYDTFPIFSRTLHPLPLKTLAWSHATSNPSTSHGKNNHVQAKNINKSLLALGQVIWALAHKQKHIPQLVAESAQQNPGKP